MEKEQAISVLRQVIDLGVKRGIFSTGGEVLAVEEAMGKVLFELADLRLVRQNLVTAQNELYEIRNPKD